MTVLLVVIIIVVVLVWWIALAGDGRRAARPQTGLVAVVVAVALSAGLHIGTVWLLPVMILGLVPIGIVLVTVDPRPLVAGTTCALLTAVLIVPQRGISGPGAGIGWLTMGVSRQSCSP